MPTFKNYNIWNDYEQSDLFLITTNSFIKKNGELVMGAGLAKQAKERYPKLPLLAGKVITEQCGHLGYYGLIVGKKKFGLFQVKYHFKDSADLDLIQKSVNDLHFWTLGNPDKIVTLNFPGIGNGKLDREKVLPLLQNLPDTVWIYEL